MRLTDKSYLACACQAVRLVELRRGLGEENFLWHEQVNCHRVEYIIFSGVRDRCESRTEMIVYHGRDAIAMCFPCHKSGSQLVSDHFGRFGRFQFHNPKDLSD